jgi:hypothetical protein
MIHHWIEDLLMNPLASTLPPKMKEFHPLEFASTKNLAIRALYFRILNPQSSNLS